MKIMLNRFNRYTPEEYKRKILFDLIEASEGNFIFEKDKVWRYVDLNLVAGSIESTVLNKYLSEKWFENFYKSNDKNSGYVCVGWTTWEAKCEFLKNKNIIPMRLSDYESLKNNPESVDPNTGFYRTL